MGLKHSLVDEAEPAPCPTSFNIAAHTLFTDQTVDKVALTVTGGAVSDATWTYRAMRDAVQRTAGGLLALGLKPGDRVVLRLGNTADFPLLFLATIAAGGVAVPTSAMLSPAEAAFVAADVDARFIAVGEGLELPEASARSLDGAAIRSLREGPAAPVAQTGADDLAFIVYTSGSSGKPKGVAHAQRSAWARRMMWQGWYGLGPDDVMLHAGAFNWTYTLGAGLLDPWAVGASTVIYDGPRDPGVWARLAATHRATLFAATPGVYRQLLKYGSDLRKGFWTLRHGLSAGETLVEPLAEAWERETGKPVFEALGMSEISTYVSSSPATPRREGYAGRPQPGRRVAVLAPAADTPLPTGAVGDLAVSRRDPGLMLGYWQAPAETAAAFRGEWFITGDLAEMDADGYIAHRGRADDVMNAGGYRVAPQEVEAALAAFPGVAEAAVVEQPVGTGLSIIAAFVVSTAEDVSPETLAAWCAERLASYKCPKQITLVSTLPRTATGKLLRRALVRPAQ